jgi:exodeoxyribonuclease VII small subunit
MVDRKRPTNPAPADPTPSFEESLERLESIVGDLESGNLSLEDSIARYEEGIRLSQRLGATLDEAEKRIERLIESGPGAEPTTEPMDLDPPGAGPRPGPSAEEGKLPF